MNLILEQTVDMEPATDMKDYTSGTILSSVQELMSQQVLVTNESTHPFALAPGETMTLLHRIIEETDRLSHALGASLSLPPANPKLLSLYRQHAAMSSALHIVRKPFFNIVYLA